ncbi:GDSL esterase/lipase 1-like [Prosopis cineraria]|uniref:GDSL esterase/lipase 1-like n=1 Tax=Prosopis cineraria TaxID=364024 RepID=UPI00240F5F6A|nr:GDSL esterase/lipase 1-like [Prosopis cineraria]
MARALFSLLCVTIILLSSVGCNNGGSIPSHKEALFVFGDSLFDPGNSRYTNTTQRDTPSHWPYGITYFKHPTGRISDGRVVPDFIALFAKLPIFQAYLKPGAQDYTNGANFASGGAAVLNLAPFGISFPKQVSYLKDVVNSLKQKYGEKEANRIMGSAVYLFSIGGNDYFRLSQNLTALEQAQHVQNVIGNLTNSLKEVYRLGGRKIAFQNVGPLGCTPSNRATTTNPSGRCVEFLLAMARRHNRALSVALHKLQSTLPGFKYSIFDYYKALLDMNNNPSKYGLKEGKSACCGNGAYRGSGCGGGFSGNETFQVCSNPSEYVWFDGGHTTDSANKKLAELIWHGSPHVTGPYTVKQLFESH